MKYRVLGGTGMSVSEFALGTMMFGAMGNTDHDESVRMIHTALDAGINFVDTADVYSRGESEEIVGKALKGRRDDVVLATKFALPMGPDANHRGGSRRWIMRAVEDSLRRLGTDHIDLYQMHRPDPDTDLDETLSALSDLVRAGKVRAIGSLDVPRPSRSSRRSGPPSGAATTASVPSSRRTRSCPGHRGRRAADRPALRHGRADLRPARAPAGCPGGPTRRRATATPGVGAQAVRPRRARRTRPRRRPSDGSPRSPPRRG